MDGLWTWWYEDGQKRSEVNWKDDKKDGLWTEWYVSGQKKTEHTYKDGRKISSKYWNSIGDPR